MRILVASMAGAAAFSAVAAVPRLTLRPETAEELCVRTLAGATGVPKETLVGYGYTLRRGDEMKKVRWYAPGDIWRQRAELATWKDRQGNVQRLARVNGTLPAFERKHGDREKIEAALDESEKTFMGTDAERAAWRKSWGGNGTGQFFTAKNGKLYYVEFEFAEPVKAVDGEKLLKTFVNSVKLAAASSAGKAGSNSMKWRTVENEQYRFMFDLSKSQGEAFVKNAMRVMSAMRKSYEFYVPAQKKVGLSTVRVFKTLSGYREYRQSTGDMDTSSIGLWDPNREELLVSAEGEREAAQETMRHEAFHQYLHYATGCGRHATWFNEGHAAFFESVQYNPAKNTVKVVDKGKHAVWVERDPEQAARKLSGILTMDREAFYADGTTGVSIGSWTLNESFYHYVLAWALTYFLEKGVYAREDFAAYRRVLPTYLAAMQEGADWKAATERAWEPVKDRDLAADFLVFWSKCRNAARNIR